MPTPPSVTIIIVPADEIDAFMAMYLDERRHRSGGWEMFTIRSGRYPDTFLMKATASDLGVFGADDSPDDEGDRLATRLLDKQSAVDVVPDLERFVEINTGQTARALCAHGGGNEATIPRIIDALRTGTWPDNGDAAEEAAAFAHRLLKAARIAVQDRMGVCWELRGELVF